jgi:prepilin-type N-terminal cleavage/methylation domain-containing protein
MKRKGFTLVELLVVIAIIALLMSILMPALSRVKQLAYRMVCGSHLSGIGRGLSVYANEFQDKYPRAAHGVGSMQPTWSAQGHISDWQADTMFHAYALDQLNTVTASLYLLVKYSEVSPSMFNCKGDTGSTVFSLALANADPTLIKSFTDAWDFGGRDGEPGIYCSYSYHYPYGGSQSDGGYPLNGTSNGASPICADRNPRLDKNAWRVYMNPVPPGEQAPYWDTGPLGGEYKDPDKTGNCACHEREGQNVLFVDSHVEFAHTPCVGIAKDHIYKSWAGGRQPNNEQDRQGITGSWAQAPQTEKDAVLVGESNTYPSYVQFP